MGVGSGNDRGWEMESEVQTHRFGECDRGDDVKGPSQPSLQGSIRWRVDDGKEGGNKRGQSKIAKDRQQSTASSGESDPACEFGSLIAALVYRLDLRTFLVDSRCQQLTALI